MKVLISGSNGMIGSVVAPYLASQGHAVTRLVRREPKAGEVRWDPDAGFIDCGAAKGFDGVVQLACMPWPMRWTAKFKQQMLENRIAVNSLLAKTLAGCQQKPQVLVCASGMGIYPPSGDQILTEDSPVGSDFLARLQCEGEAATAPASAAGIRVVHLRIPAVLGGPNLNRNMGRLGSGRQWSSWVSRDELACIIEYILRTETLVGPLNPTSPNPVRNAELTATQSLILGRKPGLPIPAFFLRLMTGEMADAIILPSRRMEPRKLLDSGYPFRFPRLEDALRHELGVTLSDEPPHLGKV